jgi:hypothetical protein
MAWHVAQVNVARWAVDPDGPEAQAFRDRLDPVNAVADRAPGFVWRLEDDELGNATSIRVLDDPDLLVNVSVWRDVESLLAFVTRGAHLDVMQHRRAWFERLDVAYAALWWVPAGTVPTVEEAEQRLLHLRAHGPTPYAFSLRRSFPPPEGDEPYAAEPEGVP